MAVKCMFKISVINKKNGKNSFTDNQFGIYIAKI